MNRPPITEPRPHCYRCDKPVAMCVCAGLQPLRNTVQVHILQHVKERRHALGTVRLLRAGLEAVAVHPFDLRGRSEPVDLPQGAGLLYPAPGARDLSRLAPEARPRHLVVIDGTWNQAHRMHRDNPWVAALPCYTLPPGQQGRYRIRRAPRQECLSTLEAVVQALRLLEPDLQGTEALEQAFDAMIDGQIAAASRITVQPRARRPRQGPARPIPEALLAAGERVVVVYAEAAPLAGDRRGPREPIRISAVDLAGERVFDRLVTPRVAPDDYQMAKLGLTTAELRAARPHDESLRAFRAFCAGRVLVAWSPWTHAWLAEGVTDAPAFLLKGVWANVDRSRIPALDLLVDGLQLPVPDLGLAGRAGERLAQALAMAQHVLRDRRDGG